MIVEQYCECTLAVLKETRSRSEAAQVCGQQLEEGTLDPPNQEVQRFYSDVLGHRGRRTSQQNRRADTGPGAWVRIIGGGFAVFWWVAFFVGGLLGWLLVMRKNVLQCSLCRAVVNAY
jgi:hypothetical protein